MKGAAKRARAEPSGAGAGTKGGKRSWLWLQGAAVGAAVALVPGSTLLIVVLLCPAIVFYVMDTTSGRPVARTMVLMGCAASFNPFRDLWNGGLSVEAAFDILSNPATPLLAWFACGAGWLASEAAYLAIRITFQMQHKTILASLRREQAALVEEWSLAELIPQK